MEVELSTPSLGSPANVFKPEKPLEQEKLTPDPKEEVKTPLPDILELSSTVKSSP
ncbi:MAG: hypothetical protein QME81_16495 [bacterium]|nr:hypothetical protein [bacterium]